MIETITGTCVVDYHLSFVRITNTLVHVYRTIRQYNNNINAYKYAFPVGSLWGTYIFTRGQTDFHRPLTMPEHLELRQRHFVRHAHRVWSLVPFVPDVSHRVTNWKPLEINWWCVVIWNIFARGNREKGHGFLPTSPPILLKLFY